jgi:hypothetical protein
MSKLCSPTQTTISIVVEDATDTGDNFLPIAHKLEFPKYNDTSDPLLWLNMCEWVLLSMMHIGAQEGGLRRVPPPG